MTESAEIGDLVGRIGGDEFDLWLDVDAESDALARAASLVEAAASLAEFSVDLPAPLGMLIGIALLDSASGEGVDDLMARADQAMYTAKRDPNRNFALALPAEALAPEVAEQATLGA
mgnify:CR=1 FL=1